MIQTIDYCEAYAEAIAAISPRLYDEIIHHKDVLSETIQVVLCGEVIVGVGFLLQGPSFAQLSKNLAEYHLHMEYETLSDAMLEELFSQYEGALPEEAEEENWAGLFFAINEHLVRKLQELFTEVQHMLPEKKLVLRTWCKGDNPGLMEYLMDLDFYPAKVTPIMVSPIDLVASIMDAEEGLPDSSEPCILELPKSFGVEQEVVILEAELTDSFWEAYQTANAAAFSVPNTLNELTYKMRDPDAKVFVALHNGAIVASVSVWGLGEHRASTENVFCAEAYRRLGITTVLMEYAFDYLRNLGYREAVLSVFGDNLPAYGLYRKLCYEIETTTVEMYYLAKEDESR